MPTPSNGSFADDEFCDVRGPWAHSELWAISRWEGDEPRPGTGDKEVRTLPDGRPVDILMGMGWGDDIPFEHWYERQLPSRGKRRADILWACGVNIVTEALAEALEDLRIRNLRTFDIDLRDIGRRKGEPIPGYVGLVPDQTLTEPVRAIAVSGAPGSMYMQGWVVKELRARNLRFVADRPFRQDVSIRGWSPPLRWD